MQYLPLITARSHLAILDLQIKPVATMRSANMQKVIQNCNQLISAARQQGVPAIATEHYPVNNATVIPEIAAHFDMMTSISKAFASACKEEAFIVKLEADRPQVILTGLEAHDAILKTALDLLKQGKQVFVVEDAVISKNAANQRSAMVDLDYYGCNVLSTEAVLAAWENGEQAEPAVNTI